MKVLKDLNAKGEQPKVFGLGIGSSVSNKMRKLISIGRGAKSEKRREWEEKDDDISELLLGQELLHL